MSLFITILLWVLGGVVIFLVGGAGLVLAVTFIAWLVHLIDVKIFTE